MLNWIGIWSSSKGMVYVPNLVGLTRSDAITLITNTGLNYSSDSSETTSNSSLGGKVKSQVPLAGTLVNSGSDISFIYYVYVAAPVTPPVAPPAPVTPPVAPVAPVTPPVTPVAPVAPVTPPVTPVAPVTPPTAYYASGCCSTSGVVYGNSNVSFANALDNMEAACITGVVTNVLTSTTGYPAQNCVTPVAPVTPPVAPVAPVAPVTPPVAPVTPPVAPVVTYCRNEQRGTSRAICDTELANYNVCYSNSNYTGEISSTFLSCVLVAPVAPVTPPVAPPVTPVAPVAPPVAPVAPVAPPVTPPVAPPAPVAPPVAPPVDPCVANPCSEACCPGLYCYCSGGACFC